MQTPTQTIQHMKGAVLSLTHSSKMMSLSSLSSYFLMTAAAKKTAFYKKMIEHPCHWLIAIRMSTVHFGFNSIIKFHGKHLEVMR